MNEPVRESGFLCVTDIQGIRHAVRLIPAAMILDSWPLVLLCPEPIFGPQAINPAEFPQIAGDHH